MHLGKSTGQKYHIKDSSLAMQAQPYKDASEIASIDTKLKHQWKYSPLFKNPLVESNLKLTGYRKKDYVLAETITGCLHVPGVTVWHHAWLKDSLGNYRMQLVDFSRHQNTCPHAGGCKLWSIEHKTIYKSYGTVYLSEALLGKVVMGKTVYKTGHIRTIQNSFPYSDYVIDYIFNSEEDFPVVPVHMYSRRKALSTSLRAWGLDPYGNIFLSNAKGDLYFFDHEVEILASLSINEQEILR